MKSQSIGSKPITPVINSYWSTAENNMNGMLDISMARFMPLSDFANASQDLSPDTPVVVYCRSGIRSSRQPFLQQKGIVQHP